MLLCYNYLRYWGVSMKLNKRGFAITSIIYSILVIVIIIMTLVLAIISSRRQTMERIQERVKKDISTIKSNDNNSEIVLNVGDEVCLIYDKKEEIAAKLENQCFYVLSYDDEYYNLFAKYNIYAGRIYEVDTENYKLIKNDIPEYGKQNVLAVGDKNGFPRVGTMPFSDTESVINNYANHIKSRFGINATGRPITYKELESDEIRCKPIGSNGCSGTRYSWITNTTYWANADPNNGKNAYLVGGDGFYGSYGNTNSSGRGARPVIEISVTDIEKFKKA